MAAFPAGLGSNEHLPLAPTAPQPCSPITVAVALAFKGGAVTMGSAFFTLCRLQFLFDVKRLVVGQKWGRCFGKGWALMKKRSPEQEQAEITAREKGGRARMAVISVYSYSGLML